MIHRLPVAQLTPKIFAWGASLTLVNFLTIQAFAETDPSKWIRRMSEASRNLDYHGVFSYSDGTGTTSFRYVHVVQDNVRHESLVHSDGPYRELRKSGDDLFFFAVPGDRIFADASLTDPLTERLRNVVVPEVDVESEHYRMVHLGEERVANRPAEKICLLPKDNHRHGLELWLDQHSALVLRSRTLNSRSEILEEIKFAHFKVGQPSDFTFVLSRSQPMESQREAKRAVNAESESANAQDAKGYYSWDPEWVPPGFTIRSRKCRKGNPAAEAPVCISTYSDGVASFSVVIDEEASELQHPVEFQRGATALVTGGILDESGDDHLFAVVGEIPLATARKILKGISYRRL